MYIHHKNLTLCVSSQCYIDVQKGNSLNPHTASYSTKREAATILVRSICSKQLPTVHMILPCTFVHVAHGTLKMDCFESLACPLSTN